MARILAIDDDEAITDLLSRALVRDGHVVAQLDEPDRDRVLDALRELSETEPAPAAAAPFTGSAVEGA